MANDIESLNVADMDIEQLEQRIELGLLVPNPTACADNTCGDFTGRGVCGTNRCVTNT